ncbi:hypothetical protein SM124_16330 [Bacillus sp. 31A1R]|uniref:Uncharacterized protein n=1 Tax=Robertmurraya mangrovi TaxID=3098077 RepID=A0ABU5J1K9_9BACI|nr:hypothetical protein [Bacillus sp. 31A1R]MDZ5473286.1 hypothetical protein [Bacillus sp. 31A1R]
MGIIKENCKVLRHEATLAINQTPGEYTYFTDLTENHYKAMIDVNIQSATGQSPNSQLIVTPRNGSPRIINFTESVVIQIEDVRTVALSTTNIVGGSMNIIKDFCICCPDSSEVRRHEGTFSFRSGNFLFTDLTENHYKAMFVVNGTLEGQVVVTPRIGNPTTITLPPDAESAIQIEDAQSVSIRTRATEFAPNTVQIIKDFCISCP